MVAMSSAFFILKGEKPNCTSTAWRKSIAETCVLVDLGDYDVRLNFLQEGFDQSRFTRTDLTGDHDEAVREPDGRFHVRLGAGVLLRQVQELRVRAQSKRQFFEFERFEVHRKW